MIQHRKVQSSNIESWGYDPEERVLEVRFKTGILHRFADVPQGAADAMSEAESVGSFFARSIRPFFKGERVEPVTVRRNGEVLAEGTVTFSQDGTQVGGADNVTWTKDTVVTLPNGEPLVPQTVEFPVTVTYPNGVEVFWGAIKDAADRSASALADVETASCS